MSNHLSVNAILEELDTKYSIQGYEFTSKGNDLG